MTQRTVQLFEADASARVSAGGGVMAGALIGHDAAHGDAEGFGDAFARSRPSAFTRRTRAARPGGVKRTF